MAPWTLHGRVPVGSCHAPPRTQESRLLPRLQHALRPPAIVSPPRQWGSPGFKDCTTKFNRLLCLASVSRSTRGLKSTLWYEDSDMVFRWLNVTAFFCFYDSHLYSLNEY